MSKTPILTKIVVKKYNDDTITPKDFDEGISDERLEDFNNDKWFYIGIKAIGIVELPTDHNSTIEQKIKSGGLWGIESDSTDSYIKEVCNEQIDQVKAFCRMLKIRVPKKVKIEYSDIEYLS